MNQEDLLEVEEPEVKADPVPAGRRDPRLPPGRVYGVTEWLWHAEPETFLPALLVIEDAPAAPIRRAVLGFVAALLLIALAWSWFGRMDVYANAPGRIQAIGRTKVVEAARTGTVAAIVVRDGAKVHEGDVVVRLDPTDALALQAQRAAQLADVQAELARWPVEIAHAHADPVDPDAQIPWTGTGADSIPVAARQREQAVLSAALAKLAATIATLQAERRADEAQRDGLQASITAQNALIATQAQYLTMIVQLEHEGWNSHAKLLETQAAAEQEQLALSTLQRKLADVQAAIGVVDSAVVAARETLAKTGEQRVAALGLEAETLSQQLAEATQTVAYMTLRAPASGTVAASAVTTVGQVVKPADQLMQVVPDNSQIEIQAYVPNVAIGFVREGQPVEVKVQTFLYTNYGTVPGTISRVARDALALLQRDTLQVASLDGDAARTTAAENTGTLVYPITVVAKRTTMLVNGREVPLTPGMAVSVDIPTERRRMLDYLLSPIVELFSTAGHER